MAAKKMTADIKKRIKKVKALVMDVDGVLTDGRIIMDDRGHEIKNFDVQDGFGIVLFHRCGFKTAIITARACGSVRLRAADLKIDKVFQDAYPKTKYYEQLLEEWTLPDDAIAYIGDDLTDLSVMKRVGLAVAVSNAVAEVKRQAHMTTGKSGGRGAVRELIELILKTQGKWKDIDFL